MNEIVQYVNYFFYLVGIGTLFPEVKRHGREADH
jgi:hypothetical protein